MATPLTLDSIIESEEMANDRISARPMPRNYTALGAAINDLRIWLGHKDLKTAILYSGGTDADSDHVQSLVDKALNF